MSDRTRLIDGSLQIQGQLLHIRGWLPLFLFCALACAHSPKPVLSVPGDVVVQPERSEAGGGRHSQQPAFAFRTKTLEATVQQRTLERATGKVDSVTTRFSLQLLQDSAGDQDYLITPAQPAQCSSSARHTAFMFALPRPPSGLGTGSLWGDSTAIDGCVGEVPVRNVVRRTFTVVSPAEAAELVVSVSETLDTRGGGVVEQHNVSVSGTGSGDGRIVFNSQGFVAATMNRTAVLAVRSSGRVSSFELRTRIEVRPEN